MSKYQPLADYLDQQTADSIRLSFNDIDALLDSPMPASKKYHAWWSNNPDNSVMTKAWLDAGWRTQNLDLDGEKVTFVRCHDHAKPPQRESASVKAVPVNKLDLDRLNPVARNVLAVLSRRSGRSQADEAIELLNEALAP